MSKSAICSGSCKYEILWCYINSVPTSHDQQITFNKSKLNECFPTYQLTSIHPIVCLHWIQFVNDLRQIIHLTFYYIICWFYFSHIYLFFKENGFFYIVSFFLLVFPWPGKNVTLHWLKWRFLTKAFIAGNVGLSHEMHTSIFWHCKKQIGLWTCPCISGVSQTAMENTYWNGEHVLWDSHLSCVF